MKLKYSVICLIAFMSVLFTGTKAYCEQKTPVFYDIKGSFAEASINRLVEAGIIAGVTSEEFFPNNNLNRYDFAVLIAKTLGVQPIFPTEPTFSDIPSGTLGTGYVEALFKLGLLKGVDKKYFGANQSVLRQDAAVILHRALAEETDVPSLNGRYTDVEQLAPYAEKGVAYVTWKGWMTGSENHFSPLQEITRAEASVLAYRLYQMRNEQAANSISNASGSFRLGTAETRQLEQGKTQNPLPFITSYGMDNQTICSITPDGTLFSGKEPGTGLITVNRGYNYYTVATDVYSTETKADNGEQGDMTNSLLVEKPDQYTTYSVEQDEPDPVNQQLEHKNYSGPVEGLFSKSDTWTGFLQQKGRDITVDLKRLCAVSNISMEFRQNSGLGIYLPEYLQCSVSSDGVSWYHLGYAYGAKPLSAEERSVTLVLTFPTVNARYIKLSFPVELSVFARHLSIKGGLPAEKPALLAHANLKNNFDIAGAYMQVPDCKDILLIYTGYNSFKTDWTSEDFLPVVAYLNKSGILEGRMFDTMLFIPYMFEVTCTKADWNGYMENLFTQGRQLSALDAAVEQINKITGRQDKEKVILTIPYPNVNQQDFGQLAEGGPSLSFSEAQVGKELATQNRFAAVQWYYNRLMDKWHNAGYKNLELLGIYWTEGSVNYLNIAGEKDLVQKTAGLVRNNGQNFFWIPSYEGIGFEDWKTFGFTHALIQPGYYNRKNTPLERIDKVAELAKKHNMGIEIAFDDEILSERYFNELLHKQLDKAHQLGLDSNTTIAYYMGLRSLVNCAHSNLPQARSTYENFYRWLNGSYQ